MKLLFAETLMTKTNKLKYNEGLQRLKLYIIIITQSDKNDKSLNQFS